MSLLVNSRWYNQILLSDNKDYLKSEYNGFSLETTLFFTFSGWTTGVEAN